MKNLSNPEDGDKAPLFSFQDHPVFQEIGICKNTGIHHYKNAKPKEYNKNYFLEEYKNQYKKTYLEDEAYLRSLAKKRIAMVEKYAHWKDQDWKEKSILEIGCAFGFFLDEVSQKGAHCMGIEISPEAASYGQDHLGLEIRVGNFLDPEILDRDALFDGIFSFFTIEHISNIELLWRKIYRLLKKNGILMLALPSFYGPTFQTNPQEWFRTHPEDHFYDYSPQSLSKLFQNMGLKTIVHHPLSYHKERDLGWKGKLPQKVYEFLSYHLCYADTFQIIAMKKELG